MWRTSSRTCGPPSSGSTGWSGWARRPGRPTCLSRSGSTTSSWCSCGAAGTRTTSPTSRLRRRRRRADPPTPPRVWSSPSSPPAPPPPLPLASRPASWWGATGPKNESGPSSLSIKVNKNRSNKRWERCSQNRISFSFSRLAVLETVRFHQIKFH